METIIAVLVIVVVISLVGWTVNVDTLRKSKQMLDGEIQELSKELVVWVGRYKSLEIDFGKQIKQINGYVGTIRGLRLEIKQFQDDINRHKKLIEHKNSVIDDQTESIKEYQRTQKNDRAKIKRDADMYSKRLENSVIDIKARKEAENALARIRDLCDTLETENKMLALKIKRRSPQKKHKK